MEVLKRIIFVIIIISLGIVSGYYIFSSLTNNFKKSEIPADVLQSARDINVVELESNRYHFLLFVILLELLLMLNFRIL